MQTIKIFLASSLELKEDRQHFEILIGRINQSLIKKDYFLELIIWENFIDAVSVTGLQSENNKAIATCDIFIMLFFTKVGKYTEEEFETAFGQFKNGGKPIMYIYFKDAQARIGDLSEDDMISLFSFKARLKKLGHFFSVYANIDDLKYKFSDQLNKLMEQGLIGSKRLDFEPELKQILESERYFCKTNNLYIYAANMIRALLQIENGRTFSCLNFAKRGYSQLLLLKLENFINVDLVTLKKGKPFLDLEWNARDDVKIANDLARKADANYMSEVHLLLGIIEAGGNTVKMIKSDLLDKEWSAFLTCIKSNHSVFTPI